MLTHPEIVHMYLKKIRILFQGKEMPAKKKLGQTKLRAVLANFGFPPIFQKINMSLIDIHFFFLIVCTESLISRISPRKRFSKRNHFNLFIRGPDGLDGHCQLSLEFV